LQEAFNVMKDLILMSPAAWRLRCAKSKRVCMIMAFINIYSTILWALEFESPLLLLENPM
jgi:hypothetical protein